MSNNKPVVPESARKKSKWEVANELQLDMATHKAGKTGGTIVKEMVEYAEEQQQYGADIRD